MYTNKIKNKIIKCSMVFILMIPLIGELNAQINNGTNTLGASSSSTGVSNTNTNIWSFTTGASNSITQDYGSAFGYSNSVTTSTGARFSSAFGYTSSALGNVSFAAGWAAKAQSSGSVALGYYAWSNASYSLALGKSAKTTGTSSLALGEYSEATGTSSLAIGYSSKTSATNSITIGAGVNTSNKLDNSQTNTLMVGFNSDIPTLFVGASTGVGTTGYVGIGTSSPQSKFHVKGNAGNFLLEGTDHTFISFYPDGYSAGQKGYFGFPAASNDNLTLKNEISNAHIEFLTTGNGDILLNPAGTGDIKLNARVWAHEVRVELNDPWPDFVFEKDYQLFTLVQLDDYITKNKHLPNVPSATEIAEEGVNLGEMDAILLQKIEELTLYTINQQKQLEEQRLLIEKLIKANKY